jgi:SAM-dependent methyltransferase
VNFETVRIRRSAIAASGCRRDASIPRLGGHRLDAEGCITAYHDDTAWQRDVCAYTGVAEADLAADAVRAERDASARTREAREIARLERMARAEYKLLLHREWLAALDAAIEPGQPFHVLDYGCGASSFAALALEHPEVSCALAEANGTLLAYLRWLAERRGDGRIRVIALPARPNGYGGAARMRVDAAAVDGSFDAIVLADVLEHTLDPLRVLAHLLARLRPGGIALVNYPREIEGDWHTPEAFYQRRACLMLLRACCRPLIGRAWRRRAGRLPALALSLAHRAEPPLRSAAQRFARRVFARRGEALVAKVRNEAGRDVELAQLLADV